MSYLRIVQPGEAIALNEVGLVKRFHRHYTCPHCNEALSRRKARVAVDKHVVHSRCLERYERALRAQADLQARRDMEAMEAEEQALRDANIERRGINLEEFCKGSRTAEFNTKDRQAWSEFLFFDQIRRSMNIAQTELDRWIKRVGEDPRHAFEWADSAFSAAAKLHVLGTLEAWFIAGSSHEDILKHARKTALSFAGRRSRSTSPSSNMMEDETRAIWAEVAEWGW